MARIVSKQYLREQRGEMIRLLEHSIAHWKAESAKNHRRANDLASIIGDDPGDSLSEVLQTYKGWAAEADDHLRRDRAELKKWKAKKI